MRYDHNENTYTITDRVEVIDDILKKCDCYFTVISIVNVEDQSANSRLKIAFDGKTYTMQDRSIAPASVDAVHAEFIEKAKCMDTVEKMIDEFAKKDNQVIKIVMQLLENKYTLQIPVIIEYYIRRITSDHPISADFAKSMDNIFDLFKYSGRNEYLKYICTHILDIDEVCYYAYNRFIDLIKDFEESIGEIVYPLSVLYESDDFIKFSVLSVKCASGSYYILTEDDFVSLVAADASAKVRTNKKYLLTLIDMNDVYSKNYAEHEKHMAKFQALYYFPELAKEISKAKNLPIESISVADLKNTEDYEAFFDAYASQKVESIKKNASASDLHSYVDINQIIADNIDSIIDKTDIKASYTKKGNRYIKKMKREG